LIERRRDSGIFNVWSFRGADGETHHHLVVVKVGERLEVNE